MLRAFWETLEGSQGRICPVDQSSKRSLVAVAERAVVAMVVHMAVGDFALAADGEPIGVIGDGIRIAALNRGAVGQDWRNAEAEER